MSAVVTPISCGLRHQSLGVDMLDDLENAGASVRALAVLTGVSREAITATLRRHGFELGRGAGAKVPLGPALRACFADIRGAIGNPERMTPRDRDAHYAAELKRLEFERRSGELVERSAVRDGTARAYSVVAQGLLSLPDRLERVNGLSPEAAEEAEKVVHTLMEGLHDDLAKLYHQGEES